VVLKRVESQKTELVVHSAILSLPNSRQPAVPIYDIIVLPNTDEYLIIVMPLLHSADSPSFVNVYEVVDFTLQMVEGLAYFHENRCVHRDIARGNIYMQTGMFPKGWHFLDEHQYQPGNPMTSKALLKRAPYIPRTLNPPVYLFSDFELSFHLKPGDPCYRPGRRGTHLPPEMGDDAVVDIYAVDVWALGATLKRVLDGHTSSDNKSYKEARSIMGPFVDELMTEDPVQRPTAEQALKGLRKIILTLTDTQLRSTLSPKREWSFLEIKYAITAILEGQGDEKVLFAKLRGADVSRSKSFTEGSLWERVKLVRRALRFLLKIGDGNVLQWLAPKQSKK